MKTFYSQDHGLHFPKAELYGGQLVVPFERPSRIEHVLARLVEQGFPEVAAPVDLDRSLLEAVHDPGYLAFLESAWDEWKAAGFEGELIASSFPVRRMSASRVPQDIDGKAGYYCLASETAITAGSWQAALSSCACAQSAQKQVSAGDRAAFALCRPPGHHAALDLYGGYCFINNAAVAAAGFLRDGAAKVAIVDIDFHHGNGTQDIFYERDDVFFASLHGDPEFAFPYFIGHAEETGNGRGEGCTRNYPMPPGTGYGQWRAALEDALKRVTAFGAEALVISLGVDAFKEDPISFFKLESDDFTDCGRLLAALTLPTVFVMEGGYAIEAVGINTVNVLQGFNDV